MVFLDIEMIRKRIRALYFVRGTSAEAAMWREDDAESRANLAIEGLVLEPEEAALFDMLRDEAVPPSLATQVILRLLNHPDVDPSLAVATANW